MRRTGLLLALVVTCCGPTAEDCPDAATDDAGLPVACATVDAAVVRDGGVPEIP